MYKLFIVEISSIIWKLEAIELILSQYGKNIISMGHLGKAVSGRVAP